MNGIEYDTSKKGLETVLKNWQIKALQVLWNNPNGLKSVKVWTKVGETLVGETISRASVINFLDDMKEMGVLSGVEETGKGGHHWVYFPKLDETGFKKYIVEEIITSLMRNYPEETRETISNFLLMPRLVSWASCGSEIRAHDPS